MSVMLLAINVMVDSCARLIRLPMLFPTKIVCVVPYWNVLAMMVLNASKEPLPGA